MEPVFDFLEQYQEMFRGIQLRLNEIVIPFIDAIQRASELHKEVLIVSEEVVPKGWFIPMEMGLTLEDIAGLRDLNSEELNVFF